MIREKTIFSGIKIAVVASACLFLSACAGSGPLGPTSDARMNGEWKGHPVTDAMGKWGKPILVKPDGQGTTLYEWGWGKDYVYDQYAGSDTQYVGENATYHSDGSVTYDPEYQTTDHYEKKRGSRGCMLLVHADSNGVITNVETQDYSGGCGDFHSSANSSPPDAAAAAKGKMYADRFQTIKSITARYNAACTKPEYAALFVQSPCTAVPYQLVGAPYASKMTPGQKEMLAKWTAEMSAIVKDYVAFYYSTGEAADKAVADSVESTNARIATADPRSYLYVERMTALNAIQLSRHAKAYYQQ